MKKSIILLISISLIFILITAGITGLYITKLNTLNTLTVSIDQVKIEELKLSYVKLNLSTNFFNPSNTSIDDLSATFDVLISGVKIGEGSLSQIDLLAHSNSHHSTLLTIYFADVASAVFESIQTSEFFLEIKGKAQTKIIFGLIFIEQSFSASYTYKP
jgi:LEA14-like dessication related protein